MNNNPTQPQQPQPPVQPPYPNQPYPPQGAPQGMSQGAPMSQGAYPGAYPQPPYQQPYPPQAKPPKPPMDPAKKKKLILGFSIGGGVLVLGIVAAIVLPIILRVDYSEAYSTAKDLKPKIQGIYNDSNCDNVKEYTLSFYTSMKNFNKYVESCRSLYDGVTNQVEQLAATAGVSRDGDIQERFNTFRAAYDATVPDSDKLNASLDLRTTYHQFYVNAGELPSWSSVTDAELTAAAKPLTDSDNEVFKNYGKTWLEKALATARAYRDYANNHYTSDLRNTFNDAKSDYDNYVKENSPDLDGLAPLDISDPNKMYSEYNKFYELLRTTYQQNYTSGSGDCTELFDEVYCD